jgi:phosphoribosyl-AMP cyclohydrolase
VSTDNVWIKASRSGNSGDCVELRDQAGTIQVRDSKAAGTGPILGFSRTEFGAWLAGAKSGEFDHLLE